LFVAFLQWVLSKFFFFFCFYYTNSSFCVLTAYDYIPPRRTAASTGTSRQQGPNDDTSCIIHVVRALSKLFLDYFSLLTAYNDIPPRRTAAASHDTHLSGSYVVSLFFVSIILFILIHLFVCIDSLQTHTTMTDSSCSASHLATTRPKRLYLGRKFFFLSRIWYLPPFSIVYRYCISGYRNNNRR
jgi:hypothetical protein